MESMEIAKYNDIQKVKERQRQNEMPERNVINVHKQQNITSYKKITTPILSLRQIKSS